MKTAAVLGASTDPSKFGHKAVLAYVRQGYTVWPVNPREATVAGLVAFPDVASLPGRQQEFRDSLNKALEYAEILDCKLIHCMAGIPPAGTSPVTAAALYASNLAWAGEEAKKAGRRLALEPINHRDMPGFHLNTVEQGAAVVDAIGIDKVGLQFDIYHCQVTQGDVTKRMEALIGRIVHMQIADVPARNEPGTGEIGWDFVLRRIDELGYQGWVGCEYRPAGETVAGLAWRTRFGV